MVNKYIYAGMRVVSRSHFRQLRVRGAPCQIKIHKGLAAFRFLVLAAKPLVLSKNFTSQTLI